MTTLATQNTKMRNSNLELLRVVAMLMIVAFHLAVRCETQLTDVDSIKEMGNGWFCHPEFSKKLCVLALIRPWGQIGNALFILISGYFMVSKAPQSIDLIKTSKKLLLQLGFAVILVATVAILAHQNLTVLSEVQLTRYASFNSGYWFIGYYFFVIVLGKLFLNDFLAKLSQRKYAMFVVALFALLQFSWTVKIIDNLSNEFNRVFLGIFLYSLGGYIRKYEPFKNIKAWAIIAVIILINVIVIGDFYITTTNNILNYDGGGLFIQRIPQYDNRQFVPVVLSIAIFELFKRIKINQNRVINFLGASTLMVYFIHQNTFVIEIWLTKDWITLLHKDALSFCATFLLWVLATFAVGVLCYCAYLALEKLLVKCKPLIINKREL